jgi:hypothetical protein
MPKPHPPIPPEKSSQPSSEKPLLTDEICGNIEQGCDGTFVEYWKAIGISTLPSGSVSVVNKSHCLITVKADMNGDGIAETILFQLTQKGQSKSATLGSIANLEIGCGCTDGQGNKNCSGTYCLTIHYEKT